MRVFINFFFLQGKVLKEIQAIMTQTWVEYAPPYATVKITLVQFKHGGFSSCDAPRPVWFDTVTTRALLIKLTS